MITNGEQIAFCAAYNYSMHYNGKPITMTIHFELELTTMAVHYKRERLQLPLTNVVIKTSHNDCSL